MTTDTDRNAERADAIQKRLTELAQQHSQADISRKTEFSRNNVSRYVNGTRMPIEFAAALVEGLGVNPAWLLTGEGTPYLSDISGGTREMAGDLLALVEAMAAVNRMRLGSLTGKHHLGVLRELNEALSKYEGLRANLNKHSRAIFLKLIEDTRAALMKRDLNRAETLLQALGQVSRLTDDDHLRAQYEGVQSHFHHYAGDSEAALPHQRRSYLSFLVNHGRFDEWMLPEAHNFVSVLHACSRLHEARRCARAAFAMTDNSAPTLEVAAATLDLELGDLQRGLDSLRRQLPLVPADYAHNVEHSLARGQLLEGSMNIHQAVTFGGDTEAKWSRLASWATFSERKEDLRLVAELGIGRRKGLLDPENVLAVQVSCLREVLAEGGATAAQRLLVHIENTQQKGDAVSRLGEQVLATQLFRLGGQRKQALKHLEHAQELIDSLDPELTPRVEVRALHARNVLLLLDDAPKAEAHQRMRRQAEAFVKDYFDRGYHCLKPLAELLATP
ncbi:MAG: helix-turn-helix transcriptional regulator [Planctomycetes bacterium]|nr:helix-turn-helix transcriptional regulator [Planctomycetota bacterium]